MNRKSTLTAQLRASPAEVWKTVTDNSDTGWRSDLSRVEIVDEEHFIEFTTEGYQTEFTITKKEPLSLYQFTMRNKQFTGTWTGRFVPTISGGTSMVFQEELSIPNPVVALISLITMNLKKIQQSYLSDLKRKLGE